MTRIISFLILVTALCSCNPSCQVKDLFGADEFVLDSYKIKDGKFAILEMQGKDFEELDDRLLVGEGESGTVAFFGASEHIVPVDGKVCLYDVLERIDLSSMTNLFHSYILRDGKILPIDFSKLIREGDMDQNIVMHGGDRVYIAEPKAAAVYVIGDVAKQCVIDLPSGKMSLKQVIAEAGGLLNNSSTVQVIRGSLARPKIYSLRLEHILHLPNESLLVMDGDTVYISRKPLTRVGLSAYDGMHP